MGGRFGDGTAEHDSAGIGGAGNTSINARQSVQECIYTVSYVHSILKGLELMRQTLMAIILVALGILGGSPRKGLATGKPAQAPAASHPVANHDVHHDVSPPLREMARRVAASRSVTVREPEEAEENGKNSSRESTRGAASADLAQQLRPGPPVGTIAGLNFEGIDINLNDDFVVPDTNGAAGQTQFVEWVNLNYAVFDKLTGLVTLGPLPGNSLWTGFGGACETSNNGDPIAQYDKLANRWVMQQREGTVTNGQLGGPFFLCLAISTTADATGSYNRYSFALPVSFGSTQNPFPDYPKLGVWPDAYYTTLDLQDPSTFMPLVEYVCALDRNAMLEGSSATSVCLEPTDPTELNLLPADLDGFTPPPAGTPNYMLNLAAGATSSLNLWQFHVDFVNTGNSTLTGPTAIPVAPFTEACGGGGECIVQPGNGLGLDSLSDRLMYRLAYRNFGDHDTLVTNHAVEAGSTVGVRWYEVRDPGGSPLVFQEGTYSPDANDRWMGSIAMDLAGDIALGYSVSGLALDPSISYTGRTPGDPLGTLEAEQNILTGTGTQNFSNRWGDYSSMAVDPVDDCTFWYANQYLATNGSFNWMTRVASFRFPGCGNAQAILTPTAVNFGNVVVGESATQMVNVANGGTTPLNIIGVGVTGGFGESDDCVTSSPIAAGGNCTITLTYSPTALGTASGTLTLTDNVPAANGTQTAAVTGTGSGPLAALSATSLDFPPQVAFTTSAAQTVTLTNASNTALAITSISISGTNAADFAQTNTCGSSVGANSSCAIQTTFTPTLLSSESATLSIADNAAQSPQTVALAGTGTGPLAAIMPTALSFTAQLVTTTSAAQIVTLSNGSSTALAISGITISGTNASDFSETNTCGNSLAGNGSCTVSVTFTPSIPPSNESAALNIADNAAHSPQVTTLAGTGTDFSLSAASGGSTSATVTAGKTASYSLEVSGISGFTGTVNLSCSGAPALTACNVPSSVTVSGAGPATFTASVTTTASSGIAPLSRPSNGPKHLPVFLIGLAMLWLVVLRRLERSLKSAPGGVRRSRLAAGLLFGTLVWLAACSGGGGGGGSTVIPGTAPGTYPLTITGTAGGTVKNTVGLTLTVQ
jgi:hypothetical protein